MTDSMGLKLRGGFSWDHDSMRARRAAGVDRSLRLRTRLGNPAAQRSPGRAVGLLIRLSGNRAPGAGG